MSILWINGELVEKAEARVSPFDHGFLYGDGVWEHFRIFGGKLFRPEERFKCLFATAAAHGIDIPLSPTELIAAIERTVDANNRIEGYIRVIITRGPGTLGPDPRKLHPQVLIIAEEYHPFPQELYEHGLHASIFRFDANPDLLAHLARTLNQLHMVRAKRHALQNGALEAVIVDSIHNEILTGTEGKIIVLKGGEWTANHSMPDDATFRTAAKILLDVPQMARASDTPKLSDLLTADEAFLAGITCGVIGIIQVDGTPIGSGQEGPVTRQIREAYRKLTRGTE